MTIPTWFIEAAIRGGWEYRERCCRDGWGYQESIDLDPQFWRCLGKELSWYCEPHNESTNDYMMNHKREDCADWKRRALKFLDLILSEASPDALDAFWEGLRNKEI